MEGIGEMKIRITAFGIARDILDGHRSEMELTSDNSISGLKDQLMKDHPEFSRLRSLRFAIDEEYVSDDHVLTDNDEVVIIPPVSGG